MENEQQQVQEAAKRGVSPLLTGIGIGVGVSLAALAITWLVAGPALIESRVNGVVAEAVAEAIECAVAADETGADQGPPVVHEITNLVANPAGGSGFVMVSVGLEAASADDAAKIASAEHAIRDRLLRHLRSLTLSRLEESGALDALGGTVVGIVEKEAHVQVQRVFFPSFVIQ